nr:response regulator transcription factor [Ardenticatena sp.]
MTDLSPITVLIVDDHAVVRQGVRAFLETQNDIHVVGEAASGKEAVHFVEQTPPDVVVLDLVMPEMDGITAIRHIKQHSPRTQIVVLTSYAEDEKIFPAVQAGALAYLLKTIAPDDLADAIRRVAQGQPVLHPHIAMRLMQEFRQESIHMSPPSSSAAVPPAFAALTEREIEVLRLVAEGLTNQEIAERLIISTRTVKAHVSHILAKLNLSDRTQAAVYAWREGLMRPE